MVWHGSTKEDNLWMEVMFQHPGTLFSLIGELMEMWAMLGLWNMCKMEESIRLKEIVAICAGEEVYVIGSDTIYGYGLPAY